MDHAQRAAEDLGEDAHDLGAARGIVAVEVALGLLEVPVAELRPDEVVDGERGVLEAVAGEGRVHRRERGVGGREDVAVVQRERRRLAGARRVTSDE